MVKYLVMCNRYVTTECWCLVSLQKMAGIMCPIDASFHNMEIIRDICVKHNCFVIHYNCVKHKTQYTLCSAVSRMLLYNANNFLAGYCSSK